ncbi:MAG: DUF3784 domain-containing protein [Solobacterium sp.]|nr:DUF3784 domain-containing protein [Solobacterium sp.]
MSDLIWFVMTGVLFVLLGTIFIMLGWQIWKKQKMDLIISYHSSKVREENRQAYCTLAGSGVLVIGIGFLLSGICTAMSQSVLIFVPMTAGLISGLVLLAAAVMKYNR